MVALAFHWLIMLLCYGGWYVRFYVVLDLYVFSFLCELFGWSLMVSSSCGLFWFSVVVVCWCFDVDLDVHVMLLLSLYLSAIQHGGIQH